MVYSNIKELIKTIAKPILNGISFIKQRTMRKEMKTCQLQINGKKQEINEFKMAQKHRRGGKKLKDTNAIEISTSS